MATRKILLIDDDLSFYGELSQQLAQYGFEVHQAELSEDSLEEAPQIDAEIVVIAVDLPEKVGFAICHKAKKTLSIPVVLKTTTIAPEGFEKHQRLKSHADGYLDQRTLTGEQLCATIDALVGLGESSEMTAMSMDVQDMDDMGIEVEELEMDEIDIDDFDVDSLDVDVPEISEPMSPFDADQGVANTEFANDESTRVAAPAAFLEPGLDEETDAAFAAMGIGDDFGGFDTSDLSADRGGHGRSPGDLRRHSSRCHCGSA